VIEETGHEFKYIVQIDLHQFLLHCVVRILCIFSVVVLLPRRAHKEQGSLYANFIELYRSLPVLWQVKPKDFSYRNKRMKFMTYLLLNAGKQNQMPIGKS
jgi:hypothetical protein